MLEIILKINSRYKIPNNLLLFIDIYNIIIIIAWDYTKILELKIFNQSLGHPTYYLAQTNLKYYYNNIL